MWELISLDPVTHIVAGLCVARSLPAAARGPDTAVAVLAASLLPDIDVLWSLSDPATAALNRHMLTHSLVGLALLSAGFGALASLLSRRLSLMAFVMLVALAVLIHLGLDVINSFGIALLYPWSSFRFELPLVFILDPVLTGLLLGALLVSFMLRKAGPAAVACRAGLLLVVCYIAACFALRAVAEDVVKARASAVGSDHWTYLAPEPGSPLRWRGIWMEAGRYRQVLISPVSGGVVELGSVISSTPEDRLAAEARATPTGHNVEKFFKVPVWRAEGDVVIGYDLRFRFATLGNDWDPFGFCFRHSRNGFTLVHQDLDSYFANWFRALLSFGISRSLQPVQPVCPEAEHRVERLPSD